MMYNIDCNKILHLRIEGDVMHIQIPTVLLDGTVLAALSKEDMYGYALTKSYKKVSQSVNLHFIRF